jgi:aspartate-semialdehyde dehydrogenase
MNGHLAIVGATGAVGREACALLGEREWRPDRLTLLASTRSAGSRIEVGGDAVEVEPLTPDSFDGVDYAIFSAGGDRSRAFAPIAVSAGAVVVDNSSAYRMAPGW